MATHDDDSSVHTTPAPSLHQRPSKTDVHTPLRLRDETGEGAQEQEQEHHSSAAPPPPFSSHNFPSRYFPAPSPADPYSALATECAAADSAFATCASAPPTFEESSASPSGGASRVVAETKAALPRDTKQAPECSKELDDGEPPPPYTEGGSPLDGFTYVMAVAGGAASVITQVQQGPAGIAPISTSGLGGTSPYIASVGELWLTESQGRTRASRLSYGAFRDFSSMPQCVELTTPSGTRFTLSRDELLTLPEFVLLSLFPNGLLPDGHMNSYHNTGDVYPVDVSNPSGRAAATSKPVAHAPTPPSLQTITRVMKNPNLYLSDITYRSQYDPASLQYMLEFFRQVAQSLPTSAATPQDASTVPIEPGPAPLGGSARDMLQDRAGIIVLREDLDFYAIPPRRDIDATEMIEVKRAAGRELLKQDGIFSGLRKSEEEGTTERHLIEMLTAG